jgi:hypothetical protein
VAATVSLRRVWRNRISRTGIRKWRGRHGYLLGGNRRSLTGRLGNLASC